MRWEVSDPCLRLGSSAAEVVSKGYQEHSGQTTFPLARHVEFPEDSFGVVRNVGLKKQGLQLIMRFNYGL